MEYAKIEVTQETLYPSRIIHRTYKWVGKPHWVLRADQFEVDQLPFKLIRIKESDFFYGYYVRADAYYPYGWAMRIWYAIENKWQLFFLRFMATLNIWGLAFTPEGSIPSLQDIGKKRKI